MTTGLKRILFAVITIMVIHPATANNLNFPLAGFKIDSLDSKPSVAGGMPLQMYLPPKDGFSANVNVQLQPYPGTLAEYVELSLGQFNQFGFIKIADSIADNTAYFEYKGKMQNLDLHWYAKAIKSGQFVYLVTATDTQSNWPTNKAQLKSVVDSFELD